MTIRGIMYRTLYVALLCWFVINEPSHLRYYGPDLPWWVTVAFIGGMYWVIFEVLNWGNKHATGK